MKLNTAHALVLANSGIPVLPCRERDHNLGGAKSPYIAGGFHQASSDEQRILGWARRFPNAIFGLPCGPNGFIVVDADRHGKGDGVLAVLRLCSEHGFDPRAVPLVLTPGDGIHLYFGKASSQARTKSRIDEAVDLRDNGYVIAPGMKLANGRNYQLVNGSIKQLASAIASRTLPPMPNWMKILATEQPKPIVEARPTTVRGAENQLAGLVRAVASATRGNRNRMLYWAACRVGELVAQGALPADAALVLLTSAGAHAGLKAREAQATAMSGLRRGSGEGHVGC